MNLNFTINICVILKYNASLLAWASPPPGPCYIISEYRCHVYVRSDSLACVVIADEDYPPRVIFTLMSKVSAYVSTPSVTEEGQLLLKSGIFIYK